VQVYVIDKWWVDDEKGYAFLYTQFLPHCFNTALKLYTTLFQHSLETVHSVDIEIIKFTF
jgi:hypothetical protein